MTNERDADEHAIRGVTAPARVLLAGSVGIVVAVAAAFVAPWQVSSLLAWDRAAAVF